MSKKPYQIVYDNFVNKNSLFGSDTGYISEKYEQYKKTENFISDYKKILYDYYKNNKSHDGVNGWVYFLRNNKNGLIKIGYTRIGMTKRLKELNNTFKDVTVLFLIKQELPWMLESKLHDKFKNKNVDIHIDSEWFDLSYNDLLWVKNNYKTEEYKLEVKKSARRECKRRITHADKNKSD